MKKIVLSIIFSGLISSAVFAETGTDLYSIFNEYKDTDFNRIISNPEFNKALKTKENFVKKNKKTEKKESGEKESFLTEYPVSSDPLLTLPINACCENAIIKKGFYLVSSKRKGDKYFLELRQGKNAPIAVIKATSNILPVKSKLKPQVSIENFDTEIIKINYSADNLVLESILYKY